MGKREHKMSQAEWLKACKAAAKAGMKPWAWIMTRGARKSSPGRKPPTDPPPADDAPTDDTPPPTDPQPPAADEAQD